MPEKRDGEKSARHQKAAYIRHWGAIRGRLKAAGVRVWRLLTP